MQISVFWTGGDSTGGASTESIPTSFKLTAKKKLYRDTLAKALAKRNESLPASKKRKTSTEHSSKDEKVDEGIKKQFYTFICFHILPDKKTMKSKNIAERGNRSSRSGFVS